MVSKLMSLAHSKSIMLQLLSPSLLHFINYFALYFDYADILLMKVINFKAICQPERAGIEVPKDKLNSLLKIKLLFLQVENSGKV